MAIGKIPWSSVRQFAVDRGLDGPASRILWSVISGMDDAYRDWMQKEHDRNVRRETPKKPKGGKTGNRRTYAR